MSFLLFAFAKLQITTPSLTICKINFGFIFDLFSIQIWEEVFHQDSFSSIGPLSGPHNRALSSKLRLPFLSKICISVWEYVFPSNICLSYYYHISEYVLLFCFSTPKYAVADLNFPLNSSLWNLIDSSGVMFLKFVLTSKLQMKTKTYWWRVL